jgi:hypothetical protein
MLREVQGKFFLARVSASGQRELPMATVLIGLRLERWRRCTMVCREARRAGGVEVGQARLLHAAGAAGAAGAATQRQG